MLLSHSLRKRLAVFKRNNSLQMVRIMWTCSTCGMRNTDEHDVCTNETCANERHLMSTSETIQWICEICGNDKNADCELCTNCNHELSHTTEKAVCAEKRFTQIIPSPPVMCKFGWRCHFKRTCPFEHDVSDGKFGTCNSLNCARAHPDRRKMKRSQQSHLYSNHEHLKPHERTRENYYDFSCRSENGRNGYYGHRDHQRRSSYFQYASHQSKRPRQF